MLFVLSIFHLKEEDVIENMGEKPLQSSENNIQFRFDDDNQQEIFILLSFVSINLESTFDSPNAAQSISVNIEKAYLSTFYSI